MYGMYVCVYNSSAPWTIAKHEGTKQEQHKLTGSGLCPSAPVYTMYVPPRKTRATPPPLLLLLPYSISCAMPRRGRRVMVGAENMQPARSTQPGRRYHTAAVPQVSEKMVSLGVELDLDMRRKWKTLPSKGLLGLKRPNSLWHSIAVSSQENEDATTPRPTPFKVENSP